MRKSVMNPSLLSAAVVMSFASTSALAATPPPAATAPAATPALASRVANDSERERLAALDERYGDAYPGNKGIGMRRAGIALTAVGGAALALGIPLLAVAFTADSDDGYGPVILGGMSSYLVVPGVVALAVGIPLFVKGNRQRARYFEWLEEQEQRARPSSGLRVKPLFSIGRLGWGAGLRLHF